MTVQELKRLIDGNEDITIIDIREAYELEDGSICELNIPLAQFLSKIKNIVNIPFKFSNTGCETILRR